MNQIRTTDNVYHRDIEDHYINGNLKIQAVNLPVFVPQNPAVGSFSSDGLDIRPSFKAPLLMRINRLLQVALIVLSLLAIAAYSIDVMMSRNLTISQEKARRLSEQNCELSAKLIKSISFQGIQESVLGHSARQSNLKVPDEVLVAAEVPPVKCSPFNPAKHHLPLMAGY
jgi:hypothetical protein